MNNNLSKKSGHINNYFKISERSSTFKKEIIGGISTFFAMCYILAVNPAILSNANGASSYTAVFFLATVVASFFGTMLMALYAKMPIALAPGMGVNAFFAFTVAGPILGLQINEALIGTLISGLLYMIIALTPLRNYIAKMLPKNFKLAIGAMIGLFLAYVGLNDSGIIVSDAFSPSNGHVVSSTSTKFGDFADPFVIVALITMILAFVLHYLKIKGGVLIAMLIAVAMMAILNLAHVKDASNAFKFQSYKSFGKFSQLSKLMWGSFGSALANPKIYIAIFVFLYIDFFDTTGTLFAIGEQTGINKEGDKWLKDANVVDAGASMFGAIMLTSTTTAYIESSVGVSQGAKTGFASVITALLFGVSIIAWPIMSPLLPVSHVSQVPAGHSMIMPVTGPILVLVGSLMLSQLKHFDWRQTIDIPVLFVILLFGMLGFSISGGVAAGIIIYFIINIFALLLDTFYKSRGRQLIVNDESMPNAMNIKSVVNKNPNFKKRIINPVMIVLFIFAVTYFVTMPLYMY